MATRINKDPNARLDYGIDWSDWLPAGDSITSSTWTISGSDAALTQSEESHSSSQTGVWLAGGTLGGQYTVTNHIVTTAGREDDRTLTIMIVQR